MRGLATSTGNGAEGRETGEGRDYRSRMIRLFLEQKLPVMVFLRAFILSGLIAASFDRELSELSRSPLPVDVIPISITIVNEVSKTRRERAPERCVCRARIARRSWTSPCYSVQEPRETETRAHLVGPGRCSG
jgi:hypothetical protein